MQPLPLDFLEKIARDYHLSPEQREALTTRFSQPGHERAIAELLNISESALRTRMSGVYAKFSITGKGPGKLRALHDLLLTQYRQAAADKKGDLEQEQDIEAVLQTVRQAIKADITKRCGKMRVLDMEQPIELREIYTDVNILEKISGRRRKDITALMQGCTPDEFDRFTLSTIQQERVPGLEAVERHAKLLILGKPGAGKTTFLKRLGMLCNLGQFQDHRVPIFVTFKTFAEADNQPSLLDYIQQQWADCHIQDPKIVKLFLTQGRALVLLDGLDEVRETDHNRILKEIKTFTNHFDRCQFVMTCRIAARDYMFEHFTDVEVADFNDQQIDQFVKKWFTSRQDPIKAKTFIEKLDNNQPIKELATNPLLLTLLCLVFGEAADFPRNRSELYKEGLDVLLKKWDAKRNIERDQVYKQLSLKRKEGLLSQTAWTMFDRGDYFFKQKTVETQITDYIQNLPDAKTDPAALQLDSEAVLKSIEAQHGLLVERARGIYSFSHLTFQEYFTAKRIADSPATEAVASLQNLAGHITEKRWREVFLLTVEMLPDAGYLLELIKEQVDALLAGDETLQTFLTWVQEKTCSVDVSYKPAAVRAFYFSRSLSFSHSLSRSLDLNLSRSLDLDIDIDISRYLDRYLSRSLDFDLDLSLSRSLDRSRSLDFDLDLSLSRSRSHSLSRSLDRIRTKDFILHKKLQNLKRQLPDPTLDLQIFRQWWQTNGNTWREQLRTVMVEHRNIGHDWQFTDDQHIKLAQYYQANQLLVDCLNSDCYISRDVRDKLENTLLLPIASQNDAE